MGKKIEPKKYNQGKPMMSLVRPEFIKGVAEGLTYGYVKYEEKRGDIQNYLKGDGFHYSTIYDSLQRHLNEWFSGTDIDEESKLHHLKLAGANLMFLLTYCLTENGVDDRIVLDDVEERRANEPKKVAKKRRKRRSATKTKIKN